MNTGAFTKLRNDPHQFFQLNESIQNDCLTTICGKLEDVVFTAQEWPDSPYQILKLGFFINRETQLLEVRLRELAKFKQWALLAALMLFFRIEYAEQVYSGGPELKKGQHAKFLKVFQYGSFRQHQIISANSNTLCQWLIGDPGHVLLKVLSTDATVNIPDSLFETICIDAFRYDKLQTEMSKILDIIGCGYTVWPNRIHILIRISSNRRVGAPVKETLHKFRYPANHPYLFLLPYYSGTPVPTYKHASSMLEFEDMQQFETVIIPLPRPIWSRNTHGILTTPIFNKEILTVLCMHKFHRDQFNLHKDLMNILVNMLFQDYLDRLELKGRVYQTYIKARNGNYRGLYHLFNPAEFEEFTKFGDAEFYDAACICHGMELLPGRANHHKLRNTVLSKHLP